MADWRENVPKPIDGEGAWKHADRIWRVRDCAACPLQKGGTCLPQGIKVKLMPTNCCLR